MRKLGIVALGIAVLIGGAVALWKINYPTYTYRYRMTVNVLVDGKVHSGASVIEVTIRSQPQFGSAPPHISRVSGDAVFVDLGNERNVVALLASGPNARNIDYPAYIVSKLFRLTFEDSDLARLSSLQGRRELQLQDLPTLVTFTDRGSPNSAREIQPADFEREFGSGVSLGDVTIEMTSAPVTQELEKQLPFLKPMLDASKGKLVLSRPNRLDVRPILLTRS